MRPAMIYTAIGGTLLAALVLFRYDLQILRGDPSTRAYVLDRWTGDVTLIDVDTWSPVERAK